MRPVVVGALLGLMVGVALVVVLAWTSGDSYEINDSLVGTVPAGVGIGALVGLVVAIARRSRNRP